MYSSISAAYMLISLGELKRRLVGPPMPSSHVQQQRLSKVRALAVFSSDALSSVAYATEEILLVLILAGSVALSASIPISLGIVALLFVVVLSYRQTINAYPSGGGSYIVAHENLNQLAGLTAAASLLIDYVLTVAVSVASGIAAITSAFPTLFAHNVLLCLVAIFAITLVNLRGIRESSAIFSVPTYAFVFGIMVMLVTGVFELVRGTLAHEAPPSIPVQQPLTLFLLLRAFSSGCTAMTGVEAISNGVPVFRHPESQNANVTLEIMAVILATMFFGITFLSHYHGMVPLENETVVSQLARSIFGKTAPYYYIQLATMAILILAANTSYADFPRLSSLLARDRYLPRQLAGLGDRLVFSNGILMLGFLSSLLIVIFHASVHALIPLYAVGVFLSFTLSQLGMVRHWLRSKKSGWRHHMVINAVGGFVTGIVTLVIAITKFYHGAWVILLLIPTLILIFFRIKQHYASVGRQLSLVGLPPSPIVPIRRHIALLPISGVHRGVLPALRYAVSVANDVRGVYVEIDPNATIRVQEEWTHWGSGIPLVILKSPYRSVINPFLRYVDDVVRSEPEPTMVTIIVPEFITAKWWQRLLHNQTAILIRAALLFRRRPVITTVRYHLEA